MNRFLMGLLFPVVTGKLYKTTELEEIGSIEHLCFVNRRTEVLFVPFKEKL